MKESHRLGVCEAVFARVPNGCPANAIYCGFAFQSEVHDLISVTFQPWISSLKKCKELSLLIDVLETVKVLFSTNENFFTNDRRCRVNRFTQFVGRNHV